VIEDYQFGICRPFRRPPSAFTDHASETWVEEELEVAIIEGHVALMDGERMMGIAYK
jgi:hypothetical protein